MNIQARLGVSDEEFGKWKFAYVPSLRSPEYFELDATVAERLSKQHSRFSSVRLLLGDCTSLSIFEDC